MRNVLELLKEFVYALLRILACAAYEPAAFAANYSLQVFLVTAALEKCPINAAVCKAFARLANGLRREHMEPTAASNGRYAHL
jgi:hypothetical protein